jgi:hypothetical protein
MQRPTPERAPVLPVAGATHGCAGCPELWAQTTLSVVSTTALTAIAAIAAQR